MDHLQMIILKSLPINFLIIAIILCSLYYIHVTSEQQQNKKGEKEHGSMVYN